LTMPGELVAVLGGPCARAAAAGRPRSPTKSTSSVVRVHWRISFPGGRQAGEVRRHRHHLAALVHGGQLGRTIRSIPSLDHTVQEQGRTEPDQSSGDLGPSSPLAPKYQCGTPQRAHGDAPVGPPGGQPARSTRTSARIPDRYATDEFMPIFEGQRTSKKTAPPRIGPISAPAIT